jgi:Holliday junction resolvase RusA-like endonuclease
MTRRDKWKQRPCVVRYRKFKDLVRELGVELPEAGARAVFFIPMPKSWSKKKRLEMCGTPHKQRPDADNLFKALADACYQDDSGIWDFRATKFWGDEGKIVITKCGISGGGTAHATTKDMRP